MEGLDDYKLASPPEELFNFRYQEDVDLAKAKIECLKADAEYLRDQGFLTPHIGACYERAIERITKIIDSYER